MPALSVMAKISSIQIMLYEYCFFTRGLYNNDFSLLFQPNYAPIPYSFTYEAPTEDGGSSSRTESGDGAGRVEGSYTVNDLEGNSRVVEYIADEGGFRVTNLRTNEPGMVIPVVLFHKKRDRRQKKAGQ